MRDIAECGSGDCYRVYAAYTVVRRECACACSKRYWSADCFVPEYDSFDAISERQPADRDSVRQRPWK